MGSPSLMDKGGERALIPLRDVWQSVLEGIHSEAVQFWDTSTLKLDADGYDPDTMSYTAARPDVYNQKQHFRWVRSWFGQRSILVPHPIFKEVFQSARLRGRPRSLWGEFRHVLHQNVIWESQGSPDLNGFSLPQTLNGAYFSTAAMLTRLLVNHLAGILDTAADPLSGPDQSLIYHGACVGLISGQKIAIVSNDNKLREAVNDFKDVSRHYFERHQTDGALKLGWFPELIQKLDFFAPSPFNRYHKEKV